MARRPGQPTKYKPEYCEQLIEHMASGLSYQSFAGVVHIAIDTLYEWERNNPEFSDAKRHGLSRMLAFYEQVGVKGMMGEIPGYNLGAWVFNMKNRFRSIETGAWKDKHEIEHQGSVDHNHNVQITGQNIAKQIAIDPVMLLPEVNDSKE